MKPTRKSINACLPRFDELRRMYMLSGQTGFAYGVGYFGAAYADTDDHGNVINISIYSVSDAMQERHYYDWPGSCNITDIIVKAIECEYRQDFPWKYNCRQFRQEIVRDIQERIQSEVQQ